MRLLITGACGYIGAMLIPHLLADGHRIMAYDSHMFGNGNLPKDNGHLRLGKCDIRELTSLPKADAIIYLAGLTSDTACQQNEALAQAINVDAFEPFVRIAKNAAPRFIFLSSAAAYGSTSEAASEETELKPTTLYSKAKAQCEDILSRHASKDFSCVILRPAGVCGYSPRMRFDLPINRMTRDAMHGAINVYGGSQIRPHLHIMDLVSVLKIMLGSRDNGVFNVGCENLSILAAAKIVKAVVESRREPKVTINTHQLDNDRSYSINCEKLARVTKFRPRFSVVTAATDMVSRFKSGYWQDSLTNKVYTNVPI